MQPQTADPRAGCISHPAHGTRGAQHGHKTQDQLQRISYSLGLSVHHVPLLLYQTRATLEDSI